MKLKLHTITVRRLAPPLLAGAMLASCASEATEPSVEEETYTISLQLFTGNALTRATWGDGNQEQDPAATPFDRTLASVDLFILDSDNGLTPLYALEQPGAANVYTAQVKASTPGVSVDTLTRTATFTGRLMAIANMDGAGNPLFGSSDGWVAGKLPFDVRFGNDPNWHIPMWGVQSYENISIRANELKMLGDIHMIRSTAKIVVRLDDSLTSRYKIKSVEMAEGSQLLGKGGYNLPDGALTVESTRTLTYGDRCMGLRQGGEVLTTLPRVGSDGTWIAYVAESALTDSTRPYTFKVTIQEKDGPEFSGLLEFGYYSSTMAWQAPITQIVRNHIYQFTLQLAEMKFIPSVEVWKYGGKVHIELE